MILILCALYQTGSHVTETALKGNVDEGAPTSLPRPEAAYYATLKGIHNESYSPGQS